jgi:hypothetical protein
VKVKILNSRTFIKAFMRAKVIGCIDFHSNFPKVLTRKEKLLKY